jgi:hypothetical protein
MIHLLYGSNLRPAASHTFFVVCAVWCWMLIRTCLLAPLQGHLFDTGLINQVLDLLEASSKEVPFTVSNCDVRPNNSSGAQYSRVALELTSEGRCALVPCAGCCGSDTVILWFSQGAAAAGGFLPLAPTLSWDTAY